MFREKKSSKQVFLTPLNEIPLYLLSYTNFWDNQNFSDYFVITFRKKQYLCAVNHSV